MNKLANINFCLPSKVTRVIIPKLQNAPDHSSTDPALFIVLYRLTPAVLSLASKPLSVFTPPTYNLPFVSLQRVTFQKNI